MIIFDHVTRCYAPSRLSGNTLRGLLSFRQQPEKPMFTALNDISFHLPRGGSLGIIGGNGAGKSTLLKLLTRITRPTKGRITVRGSMSSLLEIGAGIDHDLSGRENIWLAGAILGMSRQAVSRRLDAIVEFADLTAFLDQPVRTYSSGMFLRLAFSVGVHLDSDILVIDEALAVGDADFQARCLARINHFRRRGGTLVLVSHDPSQLLAVCDRGLVLEHGRCQFYGPVDDALHFYSTLQGR